VSPLSHVDLRRARVAAQLLHRPDRRPAVVDLVGRLLAIQAQDIGATPLALRARARDLTLADVRAAREDRSVVRAWGPRCTLHLVTAADLPWLTALHVPQAVTGSMRRLAQEGVTGGVQTLARVVDRALDGQGPLSKAELGERLARHGVPAKGQAIVHMAVLGAAHGMVVLGPDRQGKPSYVHTGDWIGRPLDLRIDRPAALVELARRYLMAHAPAAPEDLAAWSGLPLADCRQAFTGVGDDLVRVQPGDLWRPRTAPRPTRVPVRLLPAYDEYLLGWRDRSLILDKAHTSSVWPGGGVLRPTVMSDGRIVGRWRGNAVDLFDDCDAAALAAEQRDVARFTATA
jgi:hypothetical protein